MLYFIEDHLQGTWKKLYQMNEMFKQMDDMKPQRLIDRMLQEFKCERTLEEVKTTLWLNLGINGLKPMNSSMSSIY